MSLVSQSCLTLSIEDFIFLQLKDDSLKNSSIKVQISYIQQMVSGRARQTRAPIPPKARLRESEAARGLPRQTPEMNNKSRTLF